MFGFAQRSLLTLSRIWTSSTRFLHNNFRLLTLITGLRLSATAITLPHHHQWPLTDQQVYRRTHDFFNSIDDGAIRALGARHHPRHLPCEIKVRYRGTFNGCFVIEHSDGTTRVVRVALEPAVQDAWDKVRSEVCTMKYVRLHSHIPVPRVYAYGRSKLCRFTSELQVFIIMEQMEGVPLTREALEASSTPRLRFFLNQLVDVLAEFRKLSFTRGGSLMPSDNDEEDMELGNPPVKMVGAFSIRKNEFQATGYKIRRIVTTSAKQFLDEQVRILRHMWTMPYQYLNRREAELEQFALEFMSQPEVQDRVCINSDPQSFLLVHPDLRLGNVLVDDKLRICGIIDWEYTASVPQCVFTPPTWVTGNDLGLAAVPSEFAYCLAFQKRKSKEHAQLAAEWGSKDTLSTSLSQILYDPAELDYIFTKTIMPNITRLCDIPIPDDARLQAEVDRRLETSQCFAQYLDDNNLHVDGREEEIERLLQVIEARMEQML